MPRIVVTLARRHEATKFELMAGPEKPANEQHAEFRKRIGQGPVDDDYAEIQLWESDSGMYRTQKFLTPDEHKRHAIRDAEDLKTHEDAKAPKKKPSAPEKPSK